MVAEKKTQLIWLRDQLGKQSKCSLSKFWQGVRGLTKYDKDFFSESGLQMEKIEVTVRERTTTYK